MDKNANAFLLILKTASTDFLIKWNPCRQDKRDWLEQAEQQATWIYPREGKRVGVYSIKTTRHWQCYDYKIR
jgi:hypothetical protein